MPPESQSTADMGVAVGVRPRPRTATVPGTTDDGERDTVETRPDLTAYAVLTAPARPPVSDYNPATVHWRNLSLDPDLTGLAPSRSRHARIALRRDGDPRPWPLPLRTLPAAGLAWHPTRPLVAGLVQRGRTVHPWTADYATRRVTVHERVRAALSLTPHGRGRRCLAWCGDRELALLTAPSQPPRAPSAGPAEVWAPVVCEASGPGHIVFLPGLSELAALAAATVSVLDPATGALRVLTAPAPLLIGGLEPSPTGRRLLVDHAVGTDDSVRQTDDALRWSRAVVRTDLPASDGWSEVPRTARWSGDGEDTLAVAADVPAQGTVIDLRAPLPRPRPARHVRPVRPPSSAGTALFPASATDGPRLLPITPGTDGPQLLWIHARRYGSSPTSAYAHPSLTGTDAPTAVLDLPLRWPADARPADLHRQITGAVDAATRALREELGRTGPVAVGGHSFAATLALYALAHSPGLTGAIAHSGCYNRTLTPDGFQYERRTYWQAPEVYRAFSALDFAGALDRPVLLVHGCEDTNPATPPDQAVALYWAVVATGGHARLLLLPYEGHTFRHRESLDTVAREHGAWLLAHSTNTSERT
ncbi:alpha/beta hydrolase family protein [Streptomyces scopuliridis]|uniref:alpha/beta hydrolase family protein n=1 Tax=Streptomyces scopuliridis TaxID=452529 RepID=UPI0035E16BE8